VLTYQRDFPRAAGREVFGFADDRFKATAAEFTAQLRNDAKRAWMVAAFGDLDVRCVLWSGENAWRKIVIKECGRLGRQSTQTTMNGFEDAFDFAGADDRIHFRNLRKNLVAVTFHQAAGHD